MAMNYGYPDVIQNQKQRGWLGSMLLGDKRQYGLASKYSQPELQALDQVRNMGLQGLQDIQGGSFDPIRQNALNTYRNEIIPSIANQFASNGSGTGSSAFRNAQLSAANNFGTQLAGMESQYNLSRQSLLQQLLGQGLTARYDRTYQPATGGIIGDFASQFASTAGKGLGSWASGNPLAALSNYQTLQQ